MMSEEIQTIGDALRQSVTDLIVPIQTNRVIDIEAFERLRYQAVRLAHVCKGAEEVPKSLLKELLATYSILRNEAPHFGAESETLVSMANEIESCFRMILAGAVPGERRPGVPRII